MIPDGHGPRRVNLRDRVNAKEPQSSPSERSEQYKTGVQVHVITLIAAFLKYKLAVIKIPNQTKGSGSGV